MEDPRRQATYVFETHNIVITLSDPVKWEVYFRNRKWEGTKENRRDAIANAVEFAASISRSSIEEMHNVITAQDNMFLASYL